MHDVIVIGAGGGGPVVAKELAQRGLDVLMLEAGPRFATPSTEWKHLENNANNPVTGYFRVGPTDRSKPAWIRELPQNSFLWQVAGVGGTTLHYYGNCPRAEPGVFHGYDKADRSNYDRTYEFPITYRSLIPFYEWVEETLPVQTAPMGRKEEAFFHGASKILPVQKSKDISRPAFRPQENAILQPHGTAGRVHNPHYPHAEGCTFCGFCFQGCYEPRESPRNLRAKRSTDNSYTPMALTADLWQRGGKAATLLTDAYVTKVNTSVINGETTVTGVTWRDNASGDEYTEDAKVVVMAGGCVENPRLWLNSDLPNANGWVGQGFTDHYFDWIIGMMPYDIGSSRGAGSNARCDFPGYGGLEQVGIPPAIQTFSATFSNAGMAGYYDNGAPARDGVSLQGAQSLGRLVGLDLLDLVEHVDRMLNVLVLTDDAVQTQNRVSLSTTLPPDEHGPVPRVAFPPGTRSARTIRNREFLAGKAVELVKRAGASRVYRLDWPDLILHVQSTMRMGADASNSVLDSSGEAWAVKRLFVADNSALSNSLGGPNPTLTAQALATRAAQTIFTRYFGGHPWVGHETPVSSIDERVTQAVFRRDIADAPASSRPSPRPATGPSFTG